MYLNDLVFVLWLISIFLDSVSPLDANLPYADEFHPTASASASAAGDADGANNSFSLKQDTNPSDSILRCFKNRETPGDTIHNTSAETEYNRILSEINDKHREEEEINAILQDWKLLAQKVDYILFWVFLALTTISSCIFIFILPYYKRGKLLWGRTMKKKRPLCNSLHFFVKACPKYVTVH